MEPRKETLPNPVLICAPFGRDGETLAGLLSRAGYEAPFHADLRSLVAGIDEDVGAILVTEEALPMSAIVAEALSAQPTWSDIPVVLLISRQKSGRFPVDGMVGRALSEITNVVVLERPLGTRSLLSAVEVALRSRQRQFALRDHIELLAQSHDALEAKVQERTAELKQEVVQRSRAEAALRQSQKMEAVGQLTGGIAHDFNNMLTGVIGSLDIMRRRLASNRLDDLDRFMDAATISANRAAALTQRLLAFSRRQSLDAKPTDINSLVASLDQLIRGSVDERVQLQFVLDARLPQAVVDANQLESALLNLAINGRDARPSGGQLTIETSVVELDDAYTEARPDIVAGVYVVVAVSDTGVGMPPEVLEKVFDPFFTTKPVGQGTGLGLSMVYGFVRQSGGQVRIHSQPGAGTSVKIFLPATEANAAAEPSIERRALNGDGQRVLVVEDDPAVRMLVREVLEEVGYVAVEAAEPHAAIPMLASTTPFDMMITDVGLPGMNGRELAEIARSHRPDLPILFITGYAENAAIRAGFVGTNMSMVTKPFGLDDLAEKISEMIGAAVKNVL